MKSNIIFLSVLMVLTTACRSLISEVEGPQVDPKLVLFSVISPEMDTLEVKVNKSIPLNTPRPGMYANFQPVENATVKLKSGTTEVTLPYHPRRLAYRIAASSFPISAGGTYRLEVSAPGGYQVWAECTVPVGWPNPLEVTKVDKYSSEAWMQQRALSLRLVDSPGTGHFYYVELARQFRPMFPGGPTLGYDMIGFESGEHYLTDANKDGAAFLFRTFQFDLWPPRDTLVLYSALTDEHFFRYHQSLRFFAGDNPFGEPTPIYSNVAGGLGIFAACRERRETYLLD